MDVKQVVELLRSAEIGSRPLDAVVAQAIGWRKIDEQVRDSHTGDYRSRTLWLVPKSDDPGRVPFYTTNIEAAYQLAQHAAPAHVGGYTWRNGWATAQLGEDGPIVTAHTPALALCLAALLHLKPLKD